jgi:hypothetical protein
MGALMKSVYDGPVDGNIPGAGKHLCRVQQAAPLRDIATATRSGEESGSKLPHSTET